MTIEEINKIRLAVAKLVTAYNKSAPGGFSLNAENTIEAQMEAFHDFCETMGFDFVEAQNFVTVNFIHGYHRSVTVNGLTFTAE